MILKQIRNGVVFPHGFKWLDGLNLCCWKRKNLHLQRTIKSKSPRSQSQVRNGSSKHKRKITKAFAGSILLDAAQAQSCKVQQVHWWHVHPQTGMLKWCCHGSKIDVAADLTVDMAFLELQTQCQLTNKRVKNWYVQAWLIRLMEEILHQIIGNLSHYLQGFIHPRWCRISSINSIWNLYLTATSGATTGTCGARSRSQLCLQAPMLSLLPLIMAKSDLQLLILEMKRAH